jgi:hypothetical protein
VDLPADQGVDPWRVVLASGLDRDGELMTERVALGGDEALVLEPS